MFTSARKVRVRSILLLGVRIILEVIVTINRVLFRVYIWLVVNPLRFLSRFPEAWSKRDGRGISFI